MFSLLLNTWDWLISNIYPIFTFQRLIHLQIYIYVVSTKHYCLKKFKLMLQVAVTLKTLQILPNKLQKYQIGIPETMLAKTCIKCFLYGVYSAFIFYSWGLFLKFFQDSLQDYTYIKYHTFMISCNFPIFFFSQEEKKKIFVTHIHMIIMKRASSTRHREHLVVI